MKTIPPLTALRCFEAVARLGGVTQAARELHVTHSAVSQQIRVLEETLGVALFVREARGLRPTEEGRFYALEVRAALRDITQATRRVLASFAQHWLVPRLPGFRQAHPYYRVRLVTSLQLEDLRHGGSDIGIRMGQGHWPDVAQQKLFDDEMIVVAAPHFALAPDGRFPATAEEVIECPLLSSPDAPWADWCVAAQVAQPAAARVVWSANDSNVVIGAALLGQGVALERRSLVAHALARGELVQITTVRVPYRYPYWLVWQQRETLSAQQVHFAQWLKAEVDAYLRANAALTDQ